MILSHQSDRYIKFSLNLQLLLLIVIFIAVGKLLTVKICNCKSSALSIQVVRQVDRNLLLIWVLSTMSLYFFPALLIMSLTVLPSISIKIFSLRDLFLYNSMKHKQITKLMWYLTFTFLVLITFSSLLSIKIERSFLSSFSKSIKSLKVCLLFLIIH